MFFSFSEKFYPLFVEYDIRPKNNGQKMYYDVTHGQDSSRNILGLFTVGKQAVEMMGKNGYRKALAELDTLFDGKASKYYLNHIVQNWSAEPFIGGAYITPDENWRLVRELGKPVGNKLFFAGDAYTDGEDWASVHAAALSGIEVVRQLAR